MGWAISQIFDNNNFSIIFLKLGPVPPFKKKKKKSGEKDAKEEEKKK